MNAAAVSRKLRAGGLRPLPSGTTRMREGIRVAECVGRDAAATVTVDVDSPSLEARLVADVRDVLTESGFTFEHAGARFVVKASA